VIIVRPQLRLAERMAWSSLAVDLGTGQSMEWLGVIRCLLRAPQLSEAGHEVEKRRARAALC
jgi:hypothetical protein